MPTEHCIVPAMESTQGVVHDMDLTRQVSLKSSDEAPFPPLNTNDGCIAPTEINNGAPFRLLTIEARAFLTSTIH